MKNDDIKQGNRSRQIIVSVILVLIDIALFIALVKVFSWPLVNLVGYDIADYENWFGELDNSRVYRFGAGCYECLFILLKAAVLIFIEKKNYIKSRGSKLIFVIAIIIHVILFVLFMAYLCRFLDGTNVYWILRYYLTGKEPPF